MQKLIYNIILDGPVPLRKLTISERTETTTKATTERMAYANYTLLDLICILKYKLIPITCELNKKAIVKMIEEQGIDIPAYDGELRPAVWSNDFRRVSMDWAKRDCIDVEPMCDVIHSCAQMSLFASFTFWEEDLIKFDGVTYSIYVEITDEDTLVHLVDQHTNTGLTMDANEFVHMLDYDENITIVRNSTI